MPIALKICAQGRPFETPKCIPLPGGVELCANSLPNPLDSVTSLFSKLNVALAPLVPIFTIIEVLICLKNCITAIPDCLMPPSPKPIIDCSKQLIKTLEQLIKMTPQLSVPNLVIATIDALIAFLLAFRNAIGILIEKDAVILESMTRASDLGNAQMLFLLECSKKNLDIEFNNLAAGMGPVNQLLGIVNGLLDIVGLPCLPGLVVPTELTEKALKPLDDAIAIILKIRGLIPSMNFGGGNSFGKICK
jgi:hypothetical protein